MTNFLRRASLACAVALTIAVLWASLVPSGGQVVAAEHHRSAHLASFAALALAWRWSLPQVPIPVIALSVGGFGFLHEALEISGHGHPFELDDAITDALGAIIGAVLAYLAEKLAGMK